MNIATQEKTQQEIRDAIASGGDRFLQEFKQKLKIEHKLTYNFRSKTNER